MSRSGVVSKLATISGSTQAHASTVSIRLHCSRSGSLYIFGPHPKSNRLDPVATSAWRYATKLSLLNARFPFTLCFIIFPVLSGPRSVCNQLVFLAVNYFQIVEIEDVRQTNDSQLLES